MWADGAALERAARILRDGGIVAFPTETVYGLGADAENDAAVRRVFEIKGRPLGHPVIVHLAAAAQVPNWALMPPEGLLLAKRFWPGPLTLVLPRTSRASDLVTGGQDTVAVRVPSHPLAHDILERAGIGVIAPSANRFGRPSATRARHVLADLGDAVDLVIDGGATTVGLESTIVDLAHGEPAILRPGAVTREHLEAALGARLRERGATEVRVSGSLPSHYAPAARVELFEDGAAARARLAALEARGTRTMLLDAASGSEGPARELYDKLRAADQAGVEVIVAILPPEEGLGAALRDRLQRAAAPRRHEGRNSRVE